MNAAQTTTIHTFTLSGLGEAPFTIIQPKQHPLEAGHVFYCEHCGTQIIHRHFIKSACGKTSVVGIDCLKKSGDLGLIDGVKRLKREQRQAEKEAERRAGLEAKLALQRERNGGKTDNELITELDAALEERSAQMREVTTESPVLAMLGTSMFEQSMSHAFYLIEPFSPGQLRVLKEIATKKATGARKNSKAYKAGYDAAAAQVDEAQAMLETFNAELEDIRDSIRQLRC